MGVYTGFVDGYKQEEAFGTSIITAVGDQTYLWGAISQKAVHPSPTTNVIYRATGVNAQVVEAGALWKGKEILTGSYTVGMQNGIPIWAVMGKSSTVASVHTITPAGVTGGAIDLLPSFTINHELSGTATPYQILFKGCKFIGLTLTCGWKQKYMISNIDWIAKDSVKSTVGALTNAPILPPTKNEAPYHFSNMTKTWDYGGTPEQLDGLTYMELNINPDLSPWYAHQWDGATYTGRNVKSFIEGTRKQYSLKLQYHQGSSSIWEELLAPSNTKELYFKWTRSVTDYIEITCNDCQVIKHEIITPEVGEPLIEEVIIEPRTLTISVADSITGGYYGE